MFRSPLPRMSDSFGKPIKGLILPLMRVSAGLSCIMATIMPLAPRKSALGRRCGRRSASGDSGYGATGRLGQLGEVRDGPLLESTTVCNGSLCKALHSDPYAQVETMRRWSDADSAGAGVARYLARCVGADLDIVYATGCSGGSIPGGHHGHHSTR